MPLTVRGDGLGQVAQEVALVLPACLRNAQKPLGRTQPRAALAPKAQLAADHGCTKSLFSPVVRRLHALDLKVHSAGHSRSRSRPIGRARRSSLAAAQWSSRRTRMRTGTIARQSAAREISPLWQR